MKNKAIQLLRQHDKKVIAVLLAASMGIGFPTAGAVSAADTNGILPVSSRAAEETGVYGYGTMTMTYAEFYAADVNQAPVDAVSSATTSKNKTFPNADATEPTENGYKIQGVKNVPVKVMSSASDALKARVTLNAEGTAQPEQYKLVDGNGIGAMVYNIKDTVTDATAELSTNSVWGDYEIDIIEKSTSYLRNTRSDVKDEATGANFEIGSQIQGLILETDKGYKVAAGHMENIWIQPYKIAFSLEGNMNSNEFRKLEGEKISKVTFIMPTGSYVYDLGQGVYIKPAYQKQITGVFNKSGTIFTLDETVSGLTNARIAVSSREGRQTTELLKETALTGKEYTLTTAVPQGKYASVIISSDDYADITVTYPIMSWQKEQLQSMVSSATDILTRLDDATLRSHKAEAEALLANQAATAGQADELIKELTSLIDAATEKLKNPATPAEPATPENPSAPTDGNNTSKTEDASAAFKARKSAITSATGKKNKITVKWKKVAGATGYQIQYSLNKNFKTASVKNTANVSKATITNLRADKKYYVRVRAYSKQNGKKVYSKYSAVKAVTVKK